MKTENPFVDDNREGKETTSDNNPQATPVSRKYGNGAEWDFDKEGNAFKIDGSAAMDTFTFDTKDPDHKKTDDAIYTHMVNLYKNAYGEGVLPTEYEFNTYRAQVRKSNRGRTGGTLFFPAIKFGKQREGETTPSATVTTKEQKGAPASTQTFTQEGTQKKAVAESATTPPPQGGAKTPITISGTYAIVSNDNAEKIAAKLLKQHFPNEEITQEEIAVFAEKLVDQAIKTGKNHGKIAYNKKKGFFLDGHKFDYNYTRDPKYIKGASSANAEANEVEQANAEALAEAEAEAKALAEANAEKKAEALIQIVNNNLTDKQRSALDTLLANLNAEGGGSSNAVVPEAVVPEAVVVPEGGGNAEVVDTEAVDANAVNTDVDAEGGGSDNNGAKVGPTDTEKGAKGGPALYSPPEDIFDVWFGNYNDATKNIAGLQKQIAEVRERRDSLYQSILKANEPKNDEEREKRIRDVAKLQAITDFLTALTTGVIGTTTKNYAPKAQSYAMPYLQQLANLQEVNEKRKEKYKQLESEIALKRSEDEEKALLKMYEEYSRDRRSANTMLGNYLNAQARSANSVEQMFLKADLNQWEDAVAFADYDGDYEDWAREDAYKKAEYTRTAASNKKVRKNSSSRSSSSSSSSSSSRSSSGRGTNTTKRQQVGDHYIANLEKNKTYSYEHMYTELRKIIPYAYRKDGFDEVSAKTERDFWTWVGRYIDKAEYSDKIITYLKSQGIAINTNNKASDISSGQSARENEGKVDTQENAQREDMQKQYDKIFNQKGYAR